MPHNFLALDMLPIPQSTKDNVPTFWLGLFSNDGIKDDSGSWIKEPTRMLIDGYNEEGELVHPQEVLSAWLQWDDNPIETQNLIISSAIEYTSEEFKDEKLDVNSIWYKEEGDL